MSCAFRQGEARSKSAREQIRVEGPFPVRFELIVPADGTSAAIEEAAISVHRRFWAVLRQAAACLYYLHGGIGEKAQ